MAFGGYTLVGAEGGLEDDLGETVCVMFLHLPVYLSLFILWLFIPGFAVMSLI
jgi:hypothetical protein